MVLRVPRATTTRPAPGQPRRRPVFYPESDGQPMGETDEHILATIDAFFKLDVHFLDRPDVYVASNNLLYVEEGNPRRFVVPDVYVVLGVPKGLRRVYLLWAEGQPPSFVLEVSSRGTQANDLGAKRDLYARLGVAEYFIFDPLGEYLDPRLVGFRLVDGVYQPIAPRPDGVLPSAALALELSAGDRVIEIVDPATGERYLGPHAERTARASAEIARASAEAARETAEAARQAERATLEAEIARLRAELARRDDPAG